MTEKPSEKLRIDVLTRSGGRCECVMKTCGHSGRCTAMLRGQWELHRINTNGEYTMSNVIGLCQMCHRNTPSYGVGAR